MQKSTYTEDVIFGLSFIGFAGLTAAAYYFASDRCLIGAAACFVVFTWIWTKEYKENARQLNDGEIRIHE